VFNIFNVARLHVANLHNFPLWHVFSTCWRGHQHLQSNCKVMWPPHLSWIIDGPIDEVNFNSCSWKFSLVARHALQYKKNTTYIVLHNFESMLYEFLIFYYKRWKHIEIENFPWEIIHILTSLTFSHNIHLIFLKQ